MDSPSDQESGYCYDNPYSGSQRSDFSRKSAKDCDSFFSEIEKQPLVPIGNIEKPVDRCFISEGNVYIHLDQHHIVNGGKVWLENEFKQVKWHKNGKGFTLIEESSKGISPYTDKGHEAIVGLGTFQQAACDVPGAKRKCFRTNFDQNAGLGQVFNLLKSNESNAMQALFRNDNESLLKSFPDSAFSAVSTANFTSGWTASESEYLDWAKFVNLDVTETANLMRLRVVPSVRKLFLEEEKETRKKLVDMITVLKSLELTFEDPETPPRISLALKGIARQSLSVLKELIKNWFVSKFAVRTSFLNFKSNNCAAQLLTSNMWESTIFPKKAIDDLMVNGSNFKDLSTLLKLDTYDSYRQRFQKGKVSTPRDFTRDFTRDFSRVQNVDNSVKSLSSGSGQAFRQRKDKWNKDFRSKSKSSFNQSEKFGQKGNTKSKSEFIYK